MGSSKISACPELIDYSLEWQSDLAEEYRQLNDFPYSKEAIDDYGELRARVKKCKID